LFESLNQNDLLIGALGLFAILQACLMFALWRMADKQSDTALEERMQRQTALNTMDMQLSEVLSAQADMGGGIRQLSHTLIETVSTHSNLAGRISQLSEAQQNAHFEMKRLVAERLDQVHLQMGTSLKDQTQRTMQTLGDLNTRLSLIDAAQKNITELSSSMVGLQDILANKQARGAFGEIQLEALVRDALPSSAYTLQATLSNGRRVDCLISMPNPPGSICVDAKFPLEAYHALRAAEDAPAKAAAQREFKKSVLGHVMAIRERYILAGETADSALMFLPSEAVYAELHSEFVDVVQASYRARVYIVSPTTMMATLHTVRAILKDVQMREQTGVIQREVHALLEDVNRLRERVGALRKHFNQVSEDFNEITVSTDKIVRRGGRIEQLQFDSEHIDPPPLTAAMPAPAIRQAGE
jgi:DNA recombination protein RmuC